LVLALSSKANKLLVKPMVSENMKDQVTVLLSAQHDCQWGINSLMVIEDHGCYICELENYRLGVEYFKWPMDSLAGI